MVWLQIFLERHGGQSRLAMTIQTSMLQRIGRQKFSMHRALAHVMWLKFTL
jgi:hypothetical protein